MSETTLSRDGERERRTCERCAGQLPPYDLDRYRVFCQMPDHWQGRDDEPMLRAAFEAWKCDQVTLDSLASRR